MTKIIMLANLTEENVSEIDEALAYSGVIYRVSMRDEAVIIEGDNDALHRATSALTAKGFIVK